MALTEKFDAALNLASHIHRDQTRKGSETPYLGHLLSVAGLVLEQGGTESQVIAALLHDAIEDQADSQGGAEALSNKFEETFGVEVRAMVEACTDAWTLVKTDWWGKKAGIHRSYHRHAP